MFAGFIEWEFAGVDAYMSTGMTISMCMSVVHVWKCCAFEAQTIKKEVLPISCEILFELPGR